jgi:hypothetical protein
MSKQPICFDIDGTLTSEPYNEDNLESLRENSAMMLVALSLQLERPLVISTARPERFMQQTETWLANHGLQPDAIFMRPNEQEGVPDPEIKREHLNLIRAIYGSNPLVWVDDNPKNVEMLRQEKVPVIHVNKDH